MKHPADGTRQKTKKRIRALLLCGGLLAGGYYLLPLFAAALGPAAAQAYLNSGLLHLAFPLYLYVSAILLGFRHGLCSIYAVAAAVLFLPTLLLYFQPSVWPAALIYGVVALIGNLMGWGLKTMLKKWKNAS